MKIPRFSTVKAGDRALPEVTCEVTGRRERLMV
jgi:hypothetical protein